MHHCLSGGKLAEFYAIVECHLDLMVIFTGILAQYAICVKTQVDLNTICQNNLMGQDNPMDGPWIIPVLLYLILLTVYFIFKPLELDPEIDPRLYFILLVIILDWI